MSKEEKTDRPLDWDSEIDQDGGYTTLPDGTEVVFTVAKLEKSRTKDGAKPMAKLERACEATNGAGRAKVIENLVLSTACAWKLGLFFVCVGQRKHGESIKPDWGAVEGAQGRAVLGVREWTGRDGDKMTSNEVKQYLEPVDEEDGGAPSFG